jgi:teichuronic acid exporter
MVAMSSFSTTPRRKHVGCLHLSAEPGQALKNGNIGNPQKQAHNQYPCTITSQLSVVSTWVAAGNSHSQIGAGFTGDPMSLGQSIRSGAKWVLLGNVGNRFLEFAFGVILARLLVPADFGMIVTISVFTGFVGMFSSGGMGQSLIRAKTADENDFTAVFTLQLAIGVLVYLAFFVTAPWVAHFFDNPLYTDLIRVSTLSFLLRPFFVMRTAWLNREMDFKSQSVLRIASGLLTGVASSLLAWAGVGVWSLALSGLLASLFNNIWLALITPIKLRINPNFVTMRKHSNYGFMLVANDFMLYLRKEGKNLVLSKMAGPDFLGLFNKGESLSRLPNDLLMPATMQPVFRAMSKVQDDLGQVKYLFYRTITLIMVYTIPIYVLIWWIAAPFINVVYGHKWLTAAEPIRVLVISGIFLNIIYPCGTVLASQNRLKQELWAQSINFPVMIAACIIGMNWGLKGVAWGVLISQLLQAIYFYILILRTLPTRLQDLITAMFPGTILSTLMFAVLAIAHVLLGAIKCGSTPLYLTAMLTIGGLCYASTFLLIPIPALKSEADRWRLQLRIALGIIKGIFS